jgi:hypothetical protein
MLRYACLGAYADIIMNVNFVNGRYIRVSLNFTELCNIYLFLIASALLINPQSIHNTNFNFAVIFGYLHWLHNVHNEPNF